MREIKEAFRYPTILTKAQIQSKEPKEKRSLDWKYALLRIWRLLEEKKALLFVVLFLVFITAILSLAGPFLLGYVIDTYVVNGKVDGIWKPLTLLFSIYVTLSLVTYLQNYWMIGIAQQTVYRLRTSLFTHLQHVPIRFFDKREHGDIMSRLTNDVDTISQTLNSSFIQVFSSVITLTGTVAVMFYLSPLLTVLTMTIIPVMYVAMRWITRRTRHLFKAQQKRLGELNGFVEEAISHQVIVKAYGREEQMKEDFYTKSDELRKTGYWALVYSGFIPKVMTLLNNFAFAIVVAVGGWLALGKVAGVTIGVIVIFTEYARQFTRPLNDLANQFNMVLSALAGAERIFEMLDEPKEVDEGKPLAHRLRGDVSFHNVSFRYEKEATSPTIDRMNFDVQAGETIALIGPTGAGKTTVMQLLARFYDVDEGMITIDGQPIEQYERASLRRQMAFVLQDVFLFEGTIRENIRYGRLDATDEEVEEAAKRANADSFIRQLEHRYDTVITANGSELSEGEKQLLAIARAFVAKPSILLLDEATSNIDTMTERVIQRALERLMEGRTSFVIAHRLHTIRHADRIFVLRHGRIVESGSPEALKREKGIYYEMLQTDERMS